MEEAPAVGRRIRSGTVCLAGAALYALVDRIDLTDSSIRLALTLPVPLSDEQPAESPASPDHTRCSDEH
jgi:hypothetical protein